MGRTKEPLVYIDTHIAVWIYDGKGGKLSHKALTQINTCEPIISPIVRLELQYLKEIGRLTDDPSTVIDHLKAKIGLKEQGMAFSEIVDEAMSISWTRDVFDRFIVAASMRDNIPLITTDKNIRKHYKKAVW